MGLKSSDDCVINLCVYCHILQGKGERKFWRPYGGITKASKLANELFENTGHYETCIELIENWRKG